MSSSFLLLGTSGIQVINHFPYLNLSMASYHVLHCFFAPRGSFQRLFTIQTPSTRPRYRTFHLIFWFFLTSFLELERFRLVSVSAS